MKSPIATAGLAFIALCATAAAQITPTKESLSGLYSGSWRWHVAA